MVRVEDCLKRAGEIAEISDSPRLDVELLLCRVLDCSRTSLFAWPEKPLDEAQARQFNELFEKRLQGLPIAHLLGEREFWSLPLRVNDSTLIPRPDTEILVEAALELAPQLPPDARLLDLGTGTGAIALALASEKKRWRLTAVDVSEDAVALARSNLLKCGLSNVSVFQSDWFSQVLDRQFDMIVSNPPYIDPEDPHLQQGDVRFEPLSALVAEDHGYADLHKIASEARGYLKAGGWLVMEHGYQQARRLQDELHRLGYQAIATQQDYGGNDRVTLAQWG